METRAKRIALVYDAIFPFVTGGAEKRFFELGKRLASAGHDVHLFGMKSWEGPDVISRAGMTLHGIMGKRPLYVTAGAGAGRRSISQALRFGLATCRLALSREDFDVIDCCGFPYFSLFPARVIATLRKKPLYSTWHEVWGRDYWREYLGPLGICGFLVEKLASRLPDVIISVSDLTTTKLRTELGRQKNILTIANGIDLERIAETPPAPERSDILFVGRLLEHKHADRLIAAVARLQPEYPDLRLEIIGDGPEKAKLEKMVTELGLEKNVRFSGFIAEEEVFARMKSSRLLALPSSREGFGLVVLEANACDLPVLTTDQPQNAAQYLIRNGENGWVTGADVASFADGLREMLQNRERLRPQTGIENYSWDHMAQEIENAFALPVKP